MMCLTYTDRPVSRCCDRVSKLPSCELVEKPARSLLSHEMRTILLCSFAHDELIQRISEPEERNERRDSTILSLFCINDFLTGYRPRTSSSSLAL